MDWIDPPGPNWIALATRDEPFGIVARLIPRGYESYCRILHPVYEDPAIADRNLTWHDEPGSDPWSGLSDEIRARIPEATRDAATLVIGAFSVPESAPRIRWSAVAQRLGHELGPETDYSEMMEAAGFKSWPRYLLGPLEGDLGLDACGCLIETLRPFVTGADQLWFDWFTTMTAKPGGGLLRAKLHELPDAVALESVQNSPMYWWPNDRSWCVVSDVDCAFTLVGGPEALVARVVADEELECQRVMPDYRF